MDAHNIGKITKTHKARNMLGRPDIENLLKLSRSDDAATENSEGLEDERIDLMSSVNKWRERFPVMRPEPLLTGKDLVAAGVNPGPKFKEVLEQAYNDQLNGVEDKAKLLRSAMKKLGAVR